MQRKGDLRYFKMRMWMVDPKLLCRKHLLGEHVECHMFASTISLGRKVHPDYCEVDKLRDRHDRLAIEMVRRGYKHQSPLQHFQQYHFGNIDRDRSVMDLKSRCSECFNERG